MNRQLLDIPIDRIDIEAQVRESFSPEAMLGLAQTLTQEGMRQPVIVRPVNDRYVLLVGERRLRAAKMAGLTTVPAIVDDRQYSNGEILVIQLMENVQREDLTPVEKARAIHRLMREQNWSAARVAGKIGVSQATVSRWLALLSLPDSVQAQVESGAIAASTGYELAKTESSNEQALLADEAANGNLTRDALTEMRSSNARGAGSKFTRITADMGEGFSITIRDSNLMLDRLIEGVSDFLNQARKARQKGQDLNAFRKMLREQSKVTQ